MGKYDHKIDVWSLGCVIIEMTTAKQPWSECNFENPFRALYHIGELLLDLVLRRHTHTPHAQTSRLTDSHDLITQ